MLRLILLRVTLSIITLALVSAVIFAATELLPGDAATAILGAVGRAAPPEKRSVALGIVSACGSLGQFAVVPFADMPDLSAENFAALRAMMSPTDIAVLFTPEAVTLPAGFNVVLAETGEQMIGTPVETPTTGVDIVTLGIDDVPAMLERLGQ